jgi:hypothetical protein
MKLIPLKGGGEYDCLSKWKKYIHNSPKSLRYAKRKFNKRVRKDGKKQCLVRE